METYLENLLRSPVEPLLFLTDPSKRIYVASAASSLLLAALVYLWRAQREGGSARGLLAYLFPRRLWLHPSSFLDVELMVAKAVIRAALFTPILLSAAVVAAFVSASLKLSFGELEPLGIGSAGIALLATLVVFTLHDGARYLLHRALHRVPRLWELHKVHHSAEVLTPLTLYRSHPVEDFLYSWLSSLCIGVTTGALFYVFGAELSQLEILGVEAIGFSFNFLGANLRHSWVWLSYGGAIERWLISPAQHQVHHSREAAHHDRNLGSFLAIWDRLGGTLYTTTREQEPLRFGLAEEERNHGPSLSSALVDPLRAVAKRGRPEGSSE